jgi:hypothetical protein
VNDGCANKAAEGGIASLSAAFYISSRRKSDLTAAFFIEGGEMEHDVSFIFRDSNDRA